MTRLSLGRNLLLCLASLLASAVIAEIVVRLLGLAPEVTQVEVDTATASFVSVEDPILRYVPKPAKGDINAWGIRDYELAFKKPPATYRIVVIGDSIAFGHCNREGLLPIDDTFPKVLERRLNGAAMKAPRPFEVINLGVSGYDTRQEVRFLELRGLAFNPDLVVVAYCLNDSWDASVELAELNRKQQRPLTSSSFFYRWLFDHSSSLRFTWQRVHLLRMSKKDGDEGGRLKAAGRASRLEGGLSQADNRVDIGFDRLEDLARVGGFDVVTVVFPLLVAEHPYEYQSAHDSVLQKSAAYGFHHLDLLEAFRTHGFKVLQGPCKNEHPGARGHAVAAEAIEKFIREIVLAS